MEITRFLRSVFRFTLVLIPVYIVAVVVWALCASPDYDNFVYPINKSGHLYTRLREVKQTQEVDVLILGSSHAYRGFDTRLFQKAGYRIFNLGSSSQTPIQTELLLENYLHTLKPKWVIYEVNPEILSMDGVESSLGIIACETWSTRLIRLCTKGSSIKPIHTFILKTLRTLFGADDDYTEPLELNGDIYIQGGYVQKQIDGYYPTPLLPKDSIYKTFQVMAFEHNIKMLNENGCKIWFVQAPVTELEYASYSNPQGFDDYMNRLGKYSNFNTFFPIRDTSLFYDNHHLNQKGVELFNRHIIDSLASLYK